MRSPGYSPFIARRDRSTPETDGLNATSRGQAAELRHHDGAFAFQAFAFQAFARASASLGRRLQRVVSLDVYRFREHLGLRFRAGLRRSDRRVRATQYSPHSGPAASPVTCCWSWRRSGRLPLQRNRNYFEDQLSEAAEPRNLCIGTRHESARDPLRNRLRARSPSFQRATLIFPALKWMRSIA